MKPFHPHTKASLWVLSATVAASLAACGGSDDAAPPDPVISCVETGPYACKSGETEPLYTFQWALNYAKSFFQTNADAGAFGGGIDLNVEPVHRQGIKGQGVNVLVIDSGVDLEHEDLAANADYSMSWNFATGKPDPNPLLTQDRDAHGTNVAGMIGAAQNGKGVMGIAPLVKLGGAALILLEKPAADEILTVENYMDAYGGAAWSRKAHVMNASYGFDLKPYAPAKSPTLFGIRGLKALRDNKGIVFVKAAGNNFDDVDPATRQAMCGPLFGAYDCTNPSDDVFALEPNVIVTAALNAKGQASGYSSAGSVVWITGMAGEYGKRGRYGEKSGLSEADIAAGKSGDGPTIYSTDIRSCAEGYSQINAERVNDFMRGVSERVAGARDNPNCDYSNMNGTSSASPTIAGVVALMLSANPDLTWRDVRDILRLSARAVDQGYERRVRSDMKAKLTVPYNALFDLTTNRFTSGRGDKSHVVAGATQLPVELGWVKNAAGNMHSNWYGFGVPDAAKAVELAKLYKREPQRSRSAEQAIPRFSTVASLQGFEYQKVTLLGEFEGKDETVDQFQVLLNLSQICLGSVGLAVESPSGTKSLLKMPLDSGVRDNLSGYEDYGAGSYAFYGENAKGKWKIYALASNPRLDKAEWGQETACDAAPAQGTKADNAQLVVAARVIAQ